MKELGEKKKCFWEWAKNTYSKAVDIWNKIPDKLSEKVNKFSEKPTVKIIEDKTLHYAGKFESGLNMLINKIGVKSTVNQLNQTADTLVNEVRYNYTKINKNPSVQRLKVDTMNMLKDFVSSFKSSHTHTV
ncbi:hypothetical protein SteCoe_25992 [Stentor coeruleus]|uniref:Uncharacterized protein n=1 Tax=Stentor coeruleus TaxID=5963 RepID=A0A1R2BE95_9CILI|nr:hypothetical protein SteCoe_25992 [Stentor coeruleus]